jgi:hypothetical protein
MGMSDLASRIHAAIMNLPCKEPSYELTERPSECRVAYKYGHRDARHAAAELVLEMLSRAEAVSEIERYQDDNHLPGHD